MFLAPWVLALAIFLLCYLAVVIFPRHKVKIAFAGAFLVILLGLLPADQILHFINFRAIIVIFALYTILAALDEAGAFDWMAHKLAVHSGHHPIALFFLFPLLAGVLAAFMDAVSSVMIFSLLLVRICHALDADPFPYVMAVIFAANTGGAMTMVGDPPNIVIGTELGYTFFDFAINTGPIAFTCLVVGLFVLYASHRKEIREAEEGKERLSKRGIALGEGTSPYHSVEDKQLLVTSLACFLLLIFVLIIHHMLHIDICIACIIPVALLFLLLPKEKVAKFLPKIDWGLLAFFVCLFIMVGALEYQGLLGHLANWLYEASHGDIIIASLAMIWLSCLLSMVVDNVPFAAAMAIVIEDLSLTTGLPADVLAWSLALGCDIGGTGTPIGAAPNLTGLSVLEQNGYAPSWIRYMRIAIPLTLGVTSLASTLVLFRYTPAPVIIICSLSEFFKWVFGTFGFLFL